MYMYIGYQKIKIIVLFFMQTRGDRVINIVVHIIVL